MEPQIAILIEALANTPQVIIPLVREVPESYLQWRPEPDAWSAHEHACHLAAVHHLFFSRLDLMLQENHPTIQPYFPDVDDDHRMAKLIVYLPKRVIPAGRDGQMVTIDFV